ncbi:MAG: NAD(P)/FAD-dependent oxidoreductase [Tagaea sp.]
MRDPNGPGWHLDRLRFDAMLRDAARGTGAALVTLDGRARARREGKVWRVRDEGSGRDYAAPILVDATGRAAALLRGLGIPRHAADRLICAHALLPPAAGDGDRCTRVRADADGWWYSARVPSGGRVLAFHLDADDPDLRGARDAAAFLARARRSPPLDDVLPARIDGTTIHMRPAGGAWSDFDACAREPGLYAVGDACLAFDPLSSQGLFHALASAESAAAAIARRLDGAADADLPFWTEMRNVRARYQAALRDVYARAARFAGRRFWARRNGARVRAG